MEAPLRLGLVAAGLAGVGAGAAALVPALPEVGIPVVLALAAATLWLVGTGMRRPPRRDAARRTAREAPEAPDDARERAEWGERIAAQLHELERLRDWLDEAGISPSERLHASRLVPALPHAEVREIRERIDALVVRRQERVWERIRAGDFVSGGGEGPDGIDDPVKIDAQAIFREIVSAVEEVARVFHRDVENPFFELTATDIALGVRSVSTELLGLLERVPVVDLARWNVGKLVRRLRTAARTKRVVDLAGPYARPLYYAGRIALGSNPAGLLAQWLLGQGVNKLAKKQAERWARDVLDAFVQLVYEQASSIYYPELAHHTSAWIALAEVLHIHAAIPGIDANRRQLMHRIVHAPIPDEWARLGLLRDLARDRAPKIKLFGNNGYLDLTEEERSAVAEQVSTHLLTLEGLRSPPARKAIHALEDRLGRGLAIDYATSGTVEQVAVREGFERLALLLRWELDVEEARVADEIRASTFWKQAVALDARDAGRDLDRVLARTLGEGLRLPYVPPRCLAGTELGSVFVDSVLDLLNRAAGPWGPEQDALAELTIDYVLSDFRAMDKARGRFLARAGEILAGRISLAALHACPKTATRLALHHLQPHELGLAVVAASAEAGEERWLLFCEDRVVFGAVPRGAALTDVEPPTVVPLPEVELIPAGKALVVRTPDGALTVAAKTLSSFEKRFGPLLAALR